MIPQKLVMVNFLSYAEEVLDFTGVEMAVITGRNGNGKSTIVDAITWALYGEGRAKKIDDFIMHGKTGTMVEYQFLLNDKLYSVIRRRDIANGGNSSLQFSMNTNKGWINLSGNGVKETEVKIMDALNMNYQTITNSSILIQGNSDEFSKRDPAQRKDVLVKILGLDIYEHLAASAREDARNLKAQIDALKIIIDKKRSEIDDDDYDIDIKTANDEMILLKDELIRVESGIEILEKSIKEKIEIVAKLNADMGIRFSINKKIDELTKEKMQSETTANLIKKKIEMTDEIQAELKDLETLENLYKEKVQTSQKYHSLRDDLNHLKMDFIDRQTKQVAKQRQCEIEYEKKLNEYNIQISKAEDKLTQCERIARMLNDVPCNGMDIQNKCKLLENALKAKEEIPELDALIYDLKPLINQLPESDLGIKLDNASDTSWEEEPKAKISELEDKIKQINFDPIDFANLENQIKGLQHLKVESGNIVKYHNDLDVQISKIEQLQNLLNGLMIDLEDINSKIDATQRRIFYFDRTEDDLKGLKSSAELVRDAIDNQNRIIASIEEKRRRKKEIEKELTEFENDIRLKEGALSVISDTAMMFSKNGIQAMLIEKSIPEIEAEANMLLGKLTDGLSITIETQRTTGKGTLAETLDIMIHDELGSRRYEMFSGGERFRIDFALRIALSRLLATRAGAKLETLIIDEGFGTQDAEGLIKLMECIKLIASDFACILVISHVDEIKEAFPVRIEVNKDSTGSHANLVA